jgi:glycosyltransferase involved in cell wall biosynthesis
LNIINIHPGILPIPPKNWGAIEKCIWNYHLNFEKLGFKSEIKYLNDIVNDGHSIIHSHVTNLANEANNRGLEYFFSMHDHHVLFDYPNENYLHETRQAVKNSIKTFVHTEEFFTHKNFEDLKDKFIYLRHGADTKLYSSSNLSRNGLLCVASNGFIGFSNFDRKGFLLARQVANHLNIPLTICCPSNTKDFLEHYGFMNDHNVKILFDLDETDLIEQYNTHKIFLHPSVLEAGHPNLTLVEALACGIPVVGTYKGSIPLNGMCVVNDLTPISYVNAIHNVLNNYEYYSGLTSKNELFTWENVSKDLIGWYKKHGHTKKKFLDTLLFSYFDKDNITHKTDTTPKLNITFDMVPSAELKAPDDNLHNIKFVSVDKYNEESIIYQNDLRNGMWARPNDIYAYHWRVYFDNELSYEKNISLDQVCAIVSSYPNSKDVKDKTINTLNNIREKIGITTICATHIDYKENPDEIKNATNDYIMNPVNTLTTHNFYRYYTGTHGNYKVELDLLHSGNAGYHGPAVHQNYYNGIRRAKELGYKYAMLTNFDMLFSEEDINKIKCLLNTVIVNESNGFFFHTNEPEGPTYKTVFCIINIDTFLSVFSEIVNEDDYNNFVSSVGSESNSLENVYYNALKNTNGLMVKNMAEWEFFNSSNCFTNSQTNYLAVMPLKFKDGDTGRAIFIRRANKNVAPYTLSLNIFSLRDNALVYSTKFDVKDELVQVVPFAFRSYRYKIQLMDDELNTQEYILEDVESIYKNGTITEI